MPRKDPVTGCMVMTMPEFLNAEAERECKGRTGGDILADIMTEIDDDSRRMEGEIRKDALSRFQQAVNDVAEYWYDDEGVDQLPTLTEVVHLLDVHVSQSFRSSGEILRGEVKDDKGRLLYVAYQYSHWSGTRLDPPEEDADFSFAEFRPMSEHPWKCFHCNRVREVGERNWTHIRQHDDPTMAVHQCPYCNGYVAAQRKRRYDRAMARQARAKAKKYGW